MSTTQSLQRRSWTSLIKNAHIKSQIPSTVEPAAWTILFIGSADPGGRAQFDVLRQDPRSNSLNHRSSVTALPWGI
jgi:hypothetical protein